MGLLKHLPLGLFFAISINDPFKKRGERKWQTIIGSAGLLPFVALCNKEFP